MSGWRCESFAAMGTTVELLAAPDLPPGARERVQVLFAAAEARFSRFRPDSELSLVNAAAGRPVAVSREFLRVLRAALAAAEASGGLFDPLVLRELEAAGYRESIENVRSGLQLQTAPVADRRTYRAIEVSKDGVVTFPEGAGLDFGGFVKGWTVDRAARALRMLGNYCINAGGDLVARGEGPYGGGWSVAIDDPFAPGRDAAVIRVRDRAVATSSTVRRRWKTQLGPAHHLIDPRTGLPSATDLASVTVVSDSAARAEVLAKELILAGGRCAMERANRDGTAALFIDGQGAVTLSGAMEEYVVA